MHKKIIPNEDLFKLYNFCLIASELKDIFDNGIITEDQYSDAIDLYISKYDDGFVNEYLSLEKIYDCKNDIHILKGVVNDYC